MDAQWNQVLLTIEEHAMAHYLCYQTYKNEQDFYAYLMRKKDNPELRQILQKKNVQHLRKNKKCMFNSKWQSWQGKKGGKKQTQKRRLSHIQRQNPYVRSTLDHGSIWLHQESRCFVLIKPKQYDFPKEIAERLYRANPISMNKPPSDSFIQGIRSVCIGKQSMVHGWRIMGILIKEISKIPESFRKSVKTGNPNVVLTPTKGTKNKVQATATKMGQPGQILGSPIIRQEGSITQLRSRSYQLNTQLSYPTHWKHHPTGVELVVLPLEKGERVASLAQQLQKAVPTEEINSRTIKHLGTVIKNKKVGAKRQNWIFLGLIIHSQAIRKTKIERV